MEEFREKRCREDLEKLSLVIERMGENSMYRIAHSL